MLKSTKLLMLIVFFFMACSHNRYRNSLPEINSEDLKFAPECYLGKPDLPSPSITKEERELVILKTKDGKFTWFDATVENGAAFNYKKQLYGKGNQLLSDKEDFPHFARAGIHSEEELHNTKIITGRSVSQITVDGRPWGSSGVGFMAEDETILSVIYADNQTVKKLGLTHPDIARPLFHFWNISRDFEKYSIDPNTNQKLEWNSLIYNGKEIKFRIQGSRGWQESIFNDEILGTGHIEIWRELNINELKFLDDNYSLLGKDKFEEIKNKLSHFHTSEMVFFYINRYGFYEGHTEYRPDPVTVALVFGLTSIKDVHKVCSGDMYHYFNTHFTTNP